MLPHVLGRAIKYAEIYELRLSAHPRHVVSFWGWSFPCIFHAPTRPGDGDNEVGKYLFPEIATRQFDKRRSWGRSSLISTLDGWWREKRQLAIISRMWHTTLHHELLSRFGRCCQIYFVFFCRETDFAYCRNRIRHTHDGAIALLLWFMITFYILFSSSSCCSSSATNFYHNESITRDETQKSSVALA